MHARDLWLVVISITLYTAASSNGRGHRRGEWLAPIGARSPRNTARPSRFKWLRRSWLKCAMVLGMSADDVAKHLERVDKAIRGGKEVPDADKSVNITDLYFRYKWGGMGPTPLPGPALKQINVVDRTTDSRWLPHFEGNGRHLGVYRTIPGYYWLLRFEAALTQHWLDHVGTAADVAERYGTD